MASHSTLAIIERYEEYRHALDELIASIVTGITNPAVFDDASARKEAVRCAGRHYPFVDLLYLLDAAGVQITPNLPVRKGHQAGGQGLGSSRAQRPYFVLAHRPATADHFFPAPSGRESVSQTFQPSGRCSASNSW